MDNDMPFDSMELQELLNPLTEDERDRLLQQLDDAHFTGCLRDFESPPIELAQKLIGLAASFSIAPISGFHVGAVAVGASGRLYLGANMEFLGVPLGASLHAEQSALLNAWMHDETAIQAIVVSEAPCGHCRQFLRELPNAAQLPIIIGQSHSTLADLLPMPFGPPRPRGLGLLDSPPTSLKSVRPIEEDNSRRALNAAQHSYAPYTHTPEGFVIECADGHIFTGRAAESIAFNPGVPAVTCALNQRNLSSSRNHSISSCAYAQLATALSSQSELTASIIRGISSAEIDTVLLDPS